MSKSRWTLLWLLAVGFVACDSESTGSGGAGPQSSASSSSSSTSGSSATASSIGGGGNSQCLASGTMCEVPEDACAELCCSGSAIPAGGFTAGSTGMTIYKCS